MSTIASILRALNERSIAGRISIRHDEARMTYPLRCNTVSSFDEFSAVIGDYYNHHFAKCFGTGCLPRIEAQARAKEILEQQYRRRNGDIVSAFNDGHDGTNGGMRVILDLLADAIKAEAVERYVREVFDAYVAPNSWEQKVALIDDFIQRCGIDLSSAIHTDQPERYAHDYRNLVREYVKGLQSTSTVFRRL